MQKLMVENSKLTELLTQRVPDYRPPGTMFARRQKPASVLYVQLLVGIRSDMFVSWQKDVLYQCGTWIRLCGNIPRKIRKRDFLKSFTTYQPTTTNRCLHFTLDL
jgi:hypothetical protein